MEAEKGWAVWEQRGHRAVLGTAELFQPAWSQLCRTESPDDNFSKPHRSWGGAGRWRPFPPPPGAHPGRWYGLAGGCRRRRGPGELVSDTFSPGPGTRGLAALVHTCTPSTHSPHAHRRRVRERLAGGPELQEAGACLQAAHPGSQG